MLERALGQIATGPGSRWGRHPSAWLGGRLAGYLAGCGDRAEQRERPGGFGAWLGVIDHQELAARVADGQLLPAQLQHADLRVAHPGRRARERLDVVPRPELPESLAGQGQLADQLRDPRIVGV